MLDGNIKAFKELSEDVTGSLREDVDVKELRTPGQTTGTTHGLGGELSQMKGRLTEAFKEYLDGCDFAQLCVVLDASPEMLVKVRLLLTGGDSGCHASQTLK